MAACRHAWRHENWISGKQFGRHGGRGLTFRAAHARGVGRQSVRVTFTFGGLKIDERNAVQDLADRPIPGLFAAGELVGGLFYENYPGGTGLMSGSVFGKLAGRHAAEYAAALKKDA